MATTYPRIKAKIKWAKVYQPDEYAGQSKWSVEVYPLDENEWKKFEDAKIQKTIKTDEDGKFFSAIRLTQKVMKNKFVYFTPPIVYGKDGSPLVIYHDEEGDTLRSFDDPNKKIIKKGTDILMGNGTVAEVTLAVYNTPKGNGSRLESVKILDLVEYVKVSASDNGKDLPSQELQGPGTAGGVDW